MKIEILLPSAIVIFQNFSTGGYCRELLVRTARDIRSCARRSYVRLNNPGEGSLREIPRSVDRVQMRNYPR
jgi:hypothetical protein